LLLFLLFPLLWVFSPAAALALIVLLDESARLVLLAHVPCPPLTAIQIEELRQTFGARW
jgi:hypothetical protein